MVVKVEEIREEGLNLREPIPRTLLSEAIGEGPGIPFRVGGDAELEASLQRVSGGVLLRGKLAAPIAVSCKRCLSEVALKLPVEFTLSLVAQSAKSRDAGDAKERTGGSEGDLSGSFDLEAVDVEPFDGKRIDLEPIVREQVVLALPMDVVCREDCRGLCGGCGQNLNEVECGCPTKAIDPRLAALKNIKLN